MKKLFHWLCQMVGGENAAVAVVEPPQIIQRFIQVPRVRDDCGVVVLADDIGESARFLLDNWQLQVVGAALELGSIAIPSGTFADIYGFDACFEPEEHFFFRHKQRQSLHLSDIMCGCASK
jgi:hypothetical protein